MQTKVKKRSGRPRKAESDKVQYQRIAIYISDYKKLVVKLEKRGAKLTDAFTEMVESYPDK